jgi:hypothetical protein
MQPPATATPRPALAGPASAALPRSSAARPRPAPAAPRQAPMAARHRASTAAQLIRTARPWRATEMRWMMAALPWSAPAARPPAARSEGRGATSGVWRRWSTASRCSCWRGMALLWGRVGIMQCVKAPAPLSSVTFGNWHTAAVRTPAHGQVLEQSLGGSGHGPVRQNNDCSAQLELRRVQPVGPPPGSAHSTRKDTMSPFGPTTSTAGWINVVIVTASAGTVVLL